MNAPTELQLRACRVCHCAFCPSSDTDRSLNDAIWQNARGGCARAVDATECALCPSLARSILHTKHPCALANGTLVLTYRIDGDIRRALFPGSIGPRDVTWDLIGSMMQNKTNGDAQRPLLGIGTLMQGGGRRWRDIDLPTLPRSWFPSSRGSQARKATRNLSKSLSHSRPNPPRVYTTSELDRYTQRRRSSIAERGETVNMAGRNPRRYLAPAAATFRPNAICPGHSGLEPGWAPQSSQEAAVAQFEQKRAWIAGAWDFYSSLTRQKKPRESCPRRQQDSPSGPEAMDLILRFDEIATRIPRQSGKAKGPQSFPRERIVASGCLFFPFGTAVPEGGASAVSALEP
ncbi:hypothetical protein ACCO45_009336 [Purpureocillium lilacinum]|uniref:Uncharacterized protein n=1 Tax=Purpureocillium lilacinum TaxID=33203 RepID=A0ACC4DJE4_PURLI